MLELQISDHFRREATGLIERNGGFVAATKADFGAGKILLRENAIAGDIPCADVVIRAGMDIAAITEEFSQQGISEPWASDTRYNISVFIDSSAAGDEPGLVDIAAALRNHGQSRRGAMVVHSEERRPQAMFEVMVNMRTL